MNVLSLFSGGGGLDLGAIQVGLSIVAAFELDPRACAAYPLVTGQTEINQTDLTKYDLTKLPDAEGIVGGPPCQDFSIAGRKAGSEGARNLWPVAISAVRVKRPDWYLFENVKGLVWLHKNRPYFEGILAALRQLGYTVDHRLLNAADFGVSQTRERVFIVGRRDGKQWTWPQPTHFKKGGIGMPRWNGWGDALGNWIGSGPTEAQLPAWILRKYPRKGFWETFPDNGYFGNQEMRHDLQHRLNWQPAFTVCASNHGRERVLHEGTIYKVDNAAKCLLQTLPFIDDAQVIGNAVPPALARAIFNAV